MSLSCGELAEGSARRVEGLGETSPDLGITLPKWVLGQLKSLQNPTLDPYNARWFPDRFPHRSRRPKWFNRKTFRARGHAGSRECDALPYDYYEFNNSILVLKQKKDLA